MVGILGALLAQPGAIAQTTQIILFDGPDFSGEQRSFSSGVRDLSNQGFNDRAESMVVVSGTWRLCSDVGYRGNCRTLGTGSYSDLSGLGLQDNISSIQRIQ